jgi:hypothetical protein
MKSSDQFASHATIWLIAIPTAFPLMALAQGGRLVPPKKGTKSAIRLLSPRHN